MSKLIAADPELYALALAVFLDVPLSDVYIDYGDNTFEIRPHKVRYDKPFEFYQQMAKEMHTLLAQTECDAPTWQELINVIRTQLPWKQTAFGEESSRYETLKKYMEGKLEDDWYVLDKTRHPEETFYYTNGFYHLLSSKKEDENHWHVRALRAAFNGETIVDDREWHETNNGEYLVCDEEEANKSEDDELKDYLEQVVLPEIPAQYRAYFDSDAWLEDARSEDDRGQRLSRYDGEENEIDISGGDEYMKAVEILRLWATEHLPELNVDSNGNPWTADSIRMLDSDDLIDVINEVYDCDPRDASTLLIYRQG